MSHYYSHVYNNCSVIPRITYPLAATSLTSKYFNKLHAALYRAVIASKGFNRQFQSPLRYDSHKYSGLGIQILHKFIYHPKYQTVIHVIVDWHQLSSGLRQPLLQNPNQTNSDVFSVWFDNILLFMAETK